MLRIWSASGLDTWPITFYSLPVYLAPLQDVILTHDLNCMLYADDTQMYIAIKVPEHSVDSVEIRQACVNDVFAWNTQNMLKSNPGKTEYCISLPVSRSNRHR